MLSHEANKRALLALNALIIQARHLAFTLGPYEKIAEILLELEGLFSLLPATVTATTEDSENFRAALERIPAPRKNYVLYAYDQKIPTAW